MSKRITPDEALEAYRIVYDLINQAFPDGGRYMATQMNIHPSYTKQMFELVRGKNEQR